MAVNLTGKINLYFSFLQCLTLKVDDVFFKFFSRLCSRSQKRKDNLVHTQYYDEYGNGKS